MSKWNISLSDDLYRVSMWGGGYFSIGEDGSLTVIPSGVSNDGSISISSIIEEVIQQDISFPIVLRFQDVLRAQVRRLIQSFSDVVEDLDYNGTFMGVYPIKVNQLREVVEEILTAGKGHQFGLEAGSKPELLAVLAYNLDPNALTILNGYKDREYMRLALLGRALNRKTIVVIEQFYELQLLVEESKSFLVKPMIGLRAKMSSQGQGKWEKSSGEKAKFGLTVPEIVRAIEYLESEGLKEQVVLFHFHIGSQITDIRSIKDAIFEGARLYCNLIKMGVPIQYFDVGGGLGVDYDGSRSTNESSMNYSLSDYVYDVVSGIKQVCDWEKVPHPDIVTESGRSITAYHSCLITDVIGSIDNAKQRIDYEPVEGDHPYVQQMLEIYKDCEANEDVQSIYNDVAQIKDDSVNAFKFGVLSLRERAKIETIYWRTLRLLQQRVPSIDFVPESLQELDKKLSVQYLCNFSVFQSTADIWAIDQILPVCPISRLDEEPIVNCSLVDITCDSDGKIDKFIDSEGVRETIPLHRLKEGEAYHIGIFLTGAYQDVMGDMHNLFGKVNEVHVNYDKQDPDGFYIEEIIQGASAKEVLSSMQYSAEYLVMSMKKSIGQAVKQGQMKPRFGVQLVDFYEACLGAQTYLSTDPIPLKTKRQQWKGV